jgi:hypothetical protein
MSDGLLRFGLLIATILVFGVVTRGVVWAVNRWQRKAK